MSETTVNLPKGIEPEVYEKAKAVILSGFKANKDENAIKTALVAQGIGFSDIVRVYKHVTINEGLVRSPKEIKADIAKVVEKGLKIKKGATSDDLTYDQFLPLIEEAMKVEGATERMVTAAIASKLGDMDLAMPTKPKAKKGTGAAAGKINTAIVDAFAKKKDLTQDEFTKVMAGVTTEKSLKKWVRMYKLFSALAKGQDAKSGLK
jgi:hypothetical protein